MPSRLIKTKADHRKLRAVMNANKKALTMTPNAGALTAGTVGSAYSVTFAAANNVGAVTYDRLSGVFPAGLVLNAKTGVLSGTPTAAGTSNFNVRATDEYGNTINQSYSIVVS